MNADEASDLFQDERGGLLLQLCDGSHTFDVGFVILIFKGGSSLLIKLLLGTLEPLLGLDSDKVDEIKKVLGIKQLTFLFDFVKRKGVSLLSSARSSLW